MPKKKKSSYPLAMLKTLQELGKPGFVSFSKRAFLKVTQRHPDKEGLISSLFENSVTSLLTLKKDKSPKLKSFTRESHQKSNLMILNDKLSSYKTGQETKSLSTLLLKILGRELTLREEASKPFWTDAFKELSEKLLLPTKTDCQDLPLTSSKPSSKEQEERSRSLKIQETLHQNKNSQKTFSQSSISTHVDKWVRDRTLEEKKSLMKTLVIEIHPTKEQRKKLDYDLHVSNYVYNKTITRINEGGKITKLSLRDELVTQETRKGNVFLNKVNSAKSRIELLLSSLRKEKRTWKNVMKRVMIIEKCWKPIKLIYDELRSNTEPVRNANVKLFEMKTHKDIKAASVFEAFTNYDNCKNAIKAGRIKFFKLKYRSKRKNGLSMTLSTKMFKLSNGVLRFTSNQLHDKVIRMTNRSRKQLRQIVSLKDSEITKKFGKYHLRIPIDVEIQEQTSYNKVIGIDPGISTFLSCYTPEKTVTVKQSNVCERINKFMKRLKQLRYERKRKRIKRKLLMKLELKKANATNELHWKSINYLTKNYDIIFIEQFDSQGFVKDGKSKSLNRNTNDLKHFQFRQRLLYKALSRGKIVEVVKAHNTTKTCSNCGSIKTMTLADREYDCKSCNQVLDRDFNAAKNMILKGLLM